MAKKKDRPEERKSLAARLIWLTIASLFLIVSLLIASALTRSCVPPPVPIIKEVTVERERTVIITTTPLPTLTSPPVTPTETATSVFETPIPRLTLVFQPTG